MAEQVRAEREGEARNLSEHRSHRGRHDRAREPDKELGGNVDLKQLGLSVKRGPTKDVVISDVDPNSDAALKGIKEGDIVLKAGNETVSSPQDVAKAVKKATGRWTARRDVPHQARR